MDTAQGIHILVVDDEKIIREGAERILAKEGWKTAIAENGDRGLALMKEAAFHILLLDLMMPGVSGMEVLKSALAIQPDILPIIITGYATIENAVEAMKRGAYDFIPKPFTPDQLRIVVRRAIDKIRLEREMQRLRLEQQRSLKDIAHEKSRTLTIINHMADGVLVTDKEGMVVLSNPALSRMLGGADDNPLGKHVSEWIKHDELVRLLDTVLGAEDRDSPGISQEMAWGDPPRSFFMAHATPVRDDEGEVFGSVTIFNDVTKLKEFDRMKSEFVDMVSHEVRSPLSSIRQKLSLIRDGYTGDITVEQKDIVERVQQRIDALIGMAGNLLDLSRIESGRLVQQRERLNLADIISETVTMMMPEADKRCLHCEVTVDAGLYPVHADRQGMETVFTNLIANAIKYNRQGGSLSVTACNRGECVEVQIKDSGVGIARENLSRIFDKFFRIRTDYTRSVAGSGIGLPLVKAIVEAHSGTIAVESEPEKGSAFTVRIPRGSGCNA
jgi:PAS domain S-box-containing protein